MISTEGLVNTPITSKLPFVYVCVCVCVVRTFQISLKNFQLFIINRVLLAVVTMLCARTPDSFIFPVNVCTLWLTSAPALQPPPADSHILLSVSGSSAFSDSTCKWNHTVYFFSAWLISLIMPSRSIHVVTKDRFSLFTWLDNILSCVQVGWK